MDNFQIINEVEELRNRINSLISCLSDSRIIDTSAFLNSKRIPSFIRLPDSGFDTAIEEARKYGSRLFTRAEALYLFEFSESFRNTVKQSGNCFWVLESLKINSSDNRNSWCLYGEEGTIYKHRSHNMFSVLCFGN